MISPSRLIAAIAAALRWRLHKWMCKPISERRDPLAFKKVQALSNLFTTPDFFPMKIDVQRNSMRFVEMSRDAYRQSVFLDHRAIRSGPCTLTAGLKRLRSLPVQGGRPLHFILHGAFCGSTLLARYLEELPHCLVLKEPLLLVQLANLKINSIGRGQRESDLWDDWFKITMALLSRAYASDAAVIVKAPDFSNWMGNFLVDQDGRTKIVFLLSPLKVFLLQVLKVDHRRQWSRERLSHLRYAMAQVPFMSEIDATDLSDGQCAAAIWLLNSFLCKELVARCGSDRVLPLNGEDLISQPQRLVGAAADFFGLTTDEEIRAVLAQFRPSSYHSKDRNAPYDAVARTRELDDAEARYGDEVKAAISWASEVGAGWISHSPCPVE